jgi:hypothetical protein
MNGVTVIFDDSGTGSVTLGGSGSTGAAFIGGQDFSAKANVTVPSGKQGPNDDPDNDGIPNLVEYAIAGQDPTVPNPKIGSFDGQTLSFTKRAGTSGLTYAIEESTDLGIGDDWDEVTHNPPNNPYVIDTTTISYTLTPGTPAGNFLRLRVDRAP